MGQIMTLFQAEEYLDRIRKTKQRMTGAGIDVLIVCDPANMNYLTGYDGWSFYVPQAVVVSLDAEQPFWIGRGMDANGAKHTTFLNDDHIIGYPDDYVQSATKHPMNFVAGQLQTRGWHNRSIGVEMDAYYFSARGFAELQQDLPRANFKDANLLVSWVRIIKSDQEIAYMQQAGKISEKVMQTALNNLSPGIRECDAVAAVYHAQMVGTPQFGGDYPAIVPMMPTGEKTSARWQGNHLQILVCPPSEHGKPPLPHHIPGHRAKGYSWLSA